MSHWRVPGPTSKLYVGQSARLTAQIPAFWTVSAANTFDSAGPDGFVHSVPLGASNLATACATASEDVPGTTIRTTRWRDTPACLISAPADTAHSIPAAMALVVHPHPFTAFGTSIQYAAIAADPAHFPGIVATLSFDPSRVTPLAYTLSIVDLVQGRSLFAGRIDWPQLRLSAQTSVVDWFTAHDFITLLITMLHAAGDNHSMYLSPAADAGMAAIRQGTPSGRRLSGGVGYVQLPGVWADETAIERYVRETHSVIAKIGPAPACGWIVDLRNNNGGDVYPMIQGVSPLLGNGRIFGFRYPSGQQDWVSLKDGAVDQNGIEVIPSVTGGPASSPDIGSAPVAVLIGPHTASSGELTAIAFIGRPATRLFGAQTGGYTTGNMGYQLFDGYLLLLAGVYDTVRNGTVYGHGVTPDETTDATGEFGTGQDLTVRAAMDWLAQQPTCRVSNAQATPAA